MRKKILYVITKSNWGGAQRYVYDLATNLPEDTFDIAVALGGSGVLAGKLQKKGIRVIRIQSLQRDINIFKEILSLFELIKIIKRESPNILHGNSSKAGGLSAFVARILGVKNILFTVHGWPFKEKRNILSKIVIAKLSWLTVFFSHHAIVVSDDDKKRASWMPFVQKKIVRIYNGVSTQHFDEQHVAREKIKSIVSASVPEGVPWVGTMSELNPNKGLSYILEACKKLKDTGKKFIFIVIGEGDERERLEKFIKKLDLSETVFLTGFIENASTLLKAFDIATLTSEKEGLPYAILEAGLAERAVVASNVGGIPEIIENEKTGLLTKPQNIKSIEHALSLLLDSHEKRENFGKALSEKVSKQFSLKKMLTETIEQY